MSNTKKDKIKGRYKRLSKDDKFIWVKRKVYRIIDWDENNRMITVPEWREMLVFIDAAWDKLTTYEKRCIQRRYSKNPSWWNRMFNRIPKRRADKNRLKKLDLKNVEDEDSLFSDDNKPCEYYW